MSTQVAERVNSIKEKLVFVYGEKKAYAILDSIQAKIKLFKENNQTVGNTSSDWVDENDIVLITYGDQIKESQKTNLQSLHEFMKGYVNGIVSSIHILPFYPYSSDDGFSVIDYYKVNQDLGSWDEVEDLAGDFDLMFDGVINHISAQSNWFQSYLKGEETYQNYFIEADPNEDYSKVTRPRALPLLTKFETTKDTKYIWTTFSEDQIDLNYKNEDVLLNIIDLLLFYVSKGAKLLRLDAIGYLWKKQGTSCIHLEEAHKIIQVFRDIFEIVAPETKIVTETNVPHKENISYFGNGYNEAQMVYQFPLPPLTLHAFQTGNAEQLLKWADSLETISSETTFFNFLASHDGIGVMPAKGILSDEEIEAMATKVIEHGGHVSYKDNGDGTKSPYELNCNYFEALSNPGDDDEIKIKRFLASQSILLSLMGVPGIYVHSLFGSMNDHQGVEKTGRARSINREKLQRTELEADLNNPTTIRYNVFNQYKHLIRTRRSEKAFHPLSKQTILFANQHVFSVLRSDVEGGKHVLCLVNISSDTQMIESDLKSYGLNGVELHDLLTEQTFTAPNGQLKLELDPYQVMWLKV